MSYELRRVTSEEEWRSYHDIRRSVLWEARGRTGYDAHHPDEYLPDHQPLLLIFEGTPVGTTRLDNRKNGTAIIRLVAVDSTKQGSGHGRELASRTYDHARQLGAHTLFVNAASEALKYYEKLGWQYFSWDSSELRGIAKDCKQMRKEIGIEPNLPVQTALKSKHSVHSNE